MVVQYGSAINQCQGLIVQWWGFIAVCRARHCQGYDRLHYKQECHRDVFSVLLFNGKIVFPHHDIFT